jgi:FtsZ-interacting cell division protein ZipA
LRITGIGKLVDREGRHLPMSSTEIVITVIVVVLLALLALGLWYALRSRELRRRFGPEYDRVMAEKESRVAAERELRERERQHRQLELRPLSEESQQRYASGWADIQAQFVDDPAAAVSAADDLVGQLVAERGYPTDDLDQQLATLSVEHSRTLGHYRDAHEINMRNERGEATTEQLRQALVHYRALFADLLGDDQVGHPDGLRDEPSDTARTSTAAEEASS